MTKYNIDTELLHTGRNPAAHFGLVNTPICRGSTILANSLEEWEARKTPENPMASYGRFGTPTTRAFEEAICEIEGGYRSIVFPSGLSACVHALLAFVQTGDHVLISDSVYGPTRAFADKVLTRMGITVEYFDPLIGAGISTLLKPNTSVVYVESPGSMTFEVQDIPAIAKASHRVGAYVVLDNTWATPLFFKPFEHDVDVSVHAATKYIVGHSDALLGVATANHRAWPLLQAGAHDFGQTAGPDDLYLALRGLRTMKMRLERHQANGIELAERLKKHPGVAQVIHPALPGDTGHELWKRDFLGASGLFGIQLRAISYEQMSVFFERLSLFGIGLSWGGFESLVLPVSQPTRAVRAWNKSGQLLRVHAGLENVDDLFADFSSALDVALAEPAAA
ncbi:cystathionine beta-lyase [Cupriavidus necator]